MKATLRHANTIGLFCFLVLGLSQFAWADDSQYRTLNLGSEGQKVDLKSHLIEGKINIIDFYSDYCVPCKAMAPSLEKLAAKDPEIVIGKVDINRPGKRGIDWGSPVAQQFRLRGIPHFKIYNEQGELVAEGQEAKNKVKELLLKNEIQ